MQTPIIGIYGGSFNPPHNGHINAVKSFISDIRPEKLYILPCFCSPFKDITEMQPSAQDRLQMAKIAFSAYGVISDFEIARCEKSFTYITVKHFKEIHKDATINLLIGTDSLVSLTKWKCFEYLAENCIFAAVCRTDNDMKAIKENARMLKEEHNADVSIIKSTPFDVSSTQIRSLIKSGQPVTDYITPEIMKYIKERGLYV